MQAPIETIQAWVEAALADGWVMTPTYKEEPQETYANLAIEGFKAMVNRRPTKNQTGEIAVWCAAGIGLRVPEQYSLEYLKHAMTMCDFCNKEGVPTVRMAFAHRCCQDCRKDPKLIAKYEYRGWCD